MKVCECCGRYRSEEESDDMRCDCSPDENGILPDLEEFNMTEYSDDGYDGDENSDYPDVLGKD